MNFPIEETNNSSIGKKLRNKRKELKMTQKDLAASVGVTFQQLQKYESGQSKISIIMLVKLCDALNVSVNYFIPNKYWRLKDSNSQLDSNLKSDFTEENLEEKLINMFNSIDDKQVKLSILALVEAIIGAK
jgi:transcriptional regulator with XRE-family HTH domain